MITMQTPQFDRFHQSRENAYRNFVVNYRLTEVPNNSSAIGDLILQASRQAIQGKASQLLRLPDCGQRNKPLLPLLVGLLDAAQQVANAIVDNALEEPHKINKQLTNDLLRQANLIAVSIANAGHS